LLGKAKVKKKRGQIAEPDNGTCYELGLEAANDDQPEVIEKRHKN
jgi:hypothetical protein